MRKFVKTMLVIVLLCANSFYTIDPSVTQPVQGDTVYASTEIGDITISPMGGTQIQTVEETIEYAYRQVDFHTNYELPGYISGYTCGITAGGNILGYYDRLYDELIPNHTGKVILGKWLYGTQGAGIEAMFDSLYTRMNADSDGVTLNGYLNGVRSYVENQGLSITMNSVRNANGTLNTPQYKTALSQGKLASVFLEGFSIIDFSNLRAREAEGYDYVKAYVNVGAHIMAVYGYYEISYYNANSQCFRVDNYLYVCTGFTTPVLALVKLNQFCVVDDLYIMDIARS